MRDDSKKEPVGDRLDALLRRFEKEQQEFENHWLWQKLGTTPAEFFACVRQSVAKSGIKPEVWQQKLAQAKKALETRVRENRGEYERVNFNNMKGLRV